MKNKRYDKNINKKDKRTGETRDGKQRKPRERMKIKVKTIKMEMKKRK